MPGDAASYDGKDVFEYEEAPKKRLPAVSIFVGLKLRLSLVGNTPESVVPDSAICEKGMYGEGPPWDYHYINETRREGNC